MMPKIDGYQMCRMVKLQDDFKSIPLVALSARQGVFDRADARLAGCVQFLSKPVSRDKLTAAITGYVSPVH